MTLPERRREPAGGEPFVGETPVEPCPPGRFSGGCGATRVGVSFRVVVGGACGRRKPRNGAEAARDRSGAGSARCPEAEAVSTKGGGRGPGLGARHAIGVEAGGTGGPRLGLRAYAGDRVRSRPPPPPRRPFRLPPPQRVQPGPRWRSGPWPARGGGRRPFVRSRPVETSTRRTDRRSPARPAADGADSVSSDRARPVLKEQQRVLIGVRRGGRALGIEALGCRCRRAVAPRLFSGSRSPPPILDVRPVSRDRGIDRSIQNLRLRAAVPPWPREQVEDENDMVTSIQCSRGRPWLTALGAGCPGRAADLFRAQVDA